MQDDLKQKIAEFLAVQARIVFVDGIHHLVGLLDKTGLERVQGLLAVPRASIAASKTVYNVQQAINL